MESGDETCIVRPDFKGLNPVSHHAGPKLNVLSIIGSKHKLCKEKDGGKVGLTSEEHSGKTRLAKDSWCLESSHQATVSKMV